MAASLAGLPVTRVLCPVDFSAHARAAVRYAARIARDTGARLTALYVNDPLLVAAAAIKVGSSTVERQSLAELRRFVDRALAGSSRRQAARLRGARLAVTCEQSTGRPAVEILNAARRDRADLIVIGTEGLSGLRKLFFGSTTHEVVRRATTPVLVVDRAMRPLGHGRWPGRRLLAPLDLGRRSDRDAHVAAAMARTTNAVLRLIHVVAPSLPPAWYEYDAAMLDRLRLARARRQIAEIAGRLEGAVSTRVVLGSPPEAIAAVARSTRSDLVVMSLGDGDGLLRARPGSIAYEVVCKAHVPVLVLPAGRTRPTARRR